MKRPVVITLLVIALTTVALGIGAVIFFTMNSGILINNPFGMGNIPSVLEESKNLKVDTERPLALVVVDDAGDVMITGADVKTVQVKVVKTAYDSTQARADEEVKGIQYTIEQSGSTVTLKYELPKSMNFSNNVNTVDFIVTVPKETTVNVDTNLGEVSVDGTKGNVDVNNDFGNLTFENIEGALSVQTNSGEVTATSIVAGSENIDLHSDFGGITLKKTNGANIALDSNSGAIALSEVRVTGDLTTQTDFGDTKFENGSANSLNIETNSGQVTLIDLKVAKELKVNNDFGEIGLQQVSAGSYDLHTNSGTITVDGVKNSLKASTDFGNITITNAQSVTLDIKTNSGTIEFSGSLGEGPHNVHSDFGGIEFNLPADSKLDVDLNTEFGRIKSEIPISVTLTESSSAEKSQIVGTMNGGGGLLTVTTNSGGINIAALSE